MRHIVFLACVLLIGMGVLPSASPQVTAQDEVRAQALGRQDFIGMVIRDPYYEWGSDPAAPNGPNTAFQDSMGVMLARTGVKWVRLDIHIPYNRSVPLSSAQVEREIAKNDYFINTVAPRHGFKVLVLLAFDLMKGTDPRQLNCESNCLVPSDFGGGVNWYMDEWLHRALMVANRYGNRVAAYEILNEQNRLPQFAGAGPAGDWVAPHILSRMTTKLYRYCKGIAVPANGCKDTQLILGGLHPRGTDPLVKDGVRISDSEYLDMVYKNAAFADFRATYGRYPVDGIGYHPYPYEIRASRQADVDFGIDRVQRVLQQYDPGKQLWITEIGYNVAFYQNKPADLGPFVRDIYTTLAQRTLADGRPAIANVFWFKYEDFAPAEGKDAQKWGIVRIPFVTDATRPDGVRYRTDGLATSEVRASYTVLRELAGMPADPPRVYVPLMEK